MVKGQRVVVTTGRDQGKSATVIGSLIGHGPVMLEVKVDGCIESRYILPSLLVPIVQENDCETVDYKPDVRCATQPIG